MRVKTPTKRPDVQKIRRLGVTKELLDSADEDLTFIKRNIIDDETFIFFTKRKHRNLEL